MATPQVHSLLNVYGGDTPHDLTQLLGTHASASIFDGGVAQIAPLNVTLTSNQPFISTGGLPIAVDQPFTTIVGAIDRILLPLSIAAGNGADTIVSLYADSGGLPSGVPLATTFVPASALSSTSTEVVSAPLQVTGLLAASKYHVVISLAGLPDSSNAVQIVLTGMVAGYSPALLPSMIKTDTGSWGNAAGLYFNIGLYLTGSTARLAHFIDDARAYSSFAYDAYGKLVQVATCTPTTINKLLANTSFFGGVVQGSTAGWTPAGCTAAVVASAAPPLGPHSASGQVYPAYNGQQCNYVLNLTSSGSGDISATSIDTLTVLAGVSYTVFAFITSARSTKVAITWLNVAGGTISTSTGSTVATGTWVQPFCSDVAPAGAVTAKIVITVVGTAGGEVSNVSAASFAVTSAKSLTYFAPGAGPGVQSSMNALQYAADGTLAAIVLGTAGTANLTPVGPLPPPTTVPNVPTGLFLVNTTTTTTAGQILSSVTMAWNNNPAADQVTGYDLQYRLPGASTFTVLSTSAATVNQVVGALTIGTTYAFSVRANNTIGPSNYSAEIAVITSGLTMTTVAPGVPTGLAAISSAIDSPAGQQATTANEVMGWALNPATDGVTSYDVQWRVPAGTVYTTQSVTINQVTFSHLNTGSTYDYSVRANNKIGASAWSTEVPAVATGTAVTASGPGTPTTFAVSGGLENIAQTNDAYVLATWDASTTADAVTVWQLQWRDITKDGTHYYTTNSGINAVKVGNLIPTHQYGFSVRAKNATNIWSSYCTELPITVAANTTPPATVTGVTSVHTPLGALVKWNANPEGDIQAYEVQVSVAGAGYVDAASAVQGTALYYVAPQGSTLATTLVFQVKAFNWNGTYSTSWAASSSVTVAGVVMDTLLAGTITVYGILAVGGGLTSSTAVPPSSGNPARFELDGNGLRYYDGTSNDYGLGANGQRANLNKSGSLTLSGTLVASLVQGTAGGVGGSGARMWADFGTPSAGTAPLLNVRDAGGYDRLQFGNLTASGGGLSPAQYGVRVNDASGTPIFDTIGLMQAAILRVSTGWHNTSLAAPATTDLTYDSGTAYGMFSVSRAVTVIGFGAFTAILNPTATACGAYAQATIVNVSTSAVVSSGALAYMEETYSSTGHSFGSVPMFLTQVALPAGSYQVHVHVTTDGNGSFPDAHAFFSLLQLGG